MIIKIETMQSFREWINCITSVSSKNKVIKLNISFFVANYIFADGESQTYKLGQTICRCGPFCRCDRTIERVREEVACGKCSSS